MWWGVPFNCKLRINQSNPWAMSQTGTSTNPLRLLFRGFFFSSASLWPDRVASSRAVWPQPEIRNIHSTCCFVSFCERVSTHKTHGIFEGWGIAWDCASLLQKGPNMSQLLHMSCSLPGEITANTCFRAVSNFPSHLRNKHRTHFKLCRCRRQATL